MVVNTEKEGRERIIGIQCHEMGFMHTQKHKDHGNICRLVLIHSIISLFTTKHLLNSQYIPSEQKDIVLPY